jgi:protein-tyrosine phosphatase
VTPDLYWIPGPWRGQLAVAARPRGADWLEDEVKSWRRAGLDVVVSLLEGEEASQLGLGLEGVLASSHGVRFQSFPIPDRGLPSSTAAARALLGEIVKHLEAGRWVAVHCRQGIGRSGLIAIGVLIASGLEADRAIEIVSAARGLSVPETADQLEWVRQLPAGEATLHI